MLQVGDVLVGRYEIEALLGEGGMGAVFRAFDILDQRRVAVKEFRLGDLPSEKDISASPDGTRGRQKTPGQLTREDALKLFKKEALLLRPLQHPNLPQVFNFFIIGSEAYIVMTLVEGKSLADLLEENGDPLPEDQMTGWLLQVLDALQYCHDKGVIHRDLKPDNLLLGNDGRIYLIDFGIAKALNPGQQATSTGIRILSPGYAPPEQYSARERSADPRTDLYSLGATAYSLLTGQIPTEATERMVGESLPEPRSLNSAISSRMDEFILRCLRILKEDRPQSAAEATTLLLPVRPQPPKPPAPRKVTTAPVQQLSTPVPRPIPRPRLHLPWRKILAGVGGATLLGLLVWFTGWKMIPAITENTQHVQATRTVAAATQQEIARLTEQAAAWTDTPTLTPGWTVTSAPTSTVTPTLAITQVFTSTNTPILTLTPSHTSTILFTPTSTLIPPVCNRTGQEWISPIDGMTLVCVRAGNFLMGNNNDYLANVKPEHTVYLDAFWIDQTEVTNTQFSKCVEARVCTSPPYYYFTDPDYANHPVVGVTWHNAEAYCFWSGRSLPSEAQWEKAARGTQDGYFPWGNGFDDQWVNQQGSSDGYSGTAPVGSFPDGASPYGALDMAGNVWEWVADWYGRDYYSSFPIDGWPDNPTGPEIGTKRVMRGGSWESYPGNLSSTYRDGFDPDQLIFDGGFRCALSTTP